MKAVKVAAHRGAMLFAPQNTVPAFQKAVELGADMIEIDVHTTKDGELILIHNSKVDGLTNGTGDVWDLTLAQIRKLDAGVRYGSHFRGTRIPTLLEALKFMREAEVEANVEIKRADIGKVVEQIETAGMEPSTMVSSPNHFLLKEARRLCPTIGILAMGLSPATIDRVIEDLRPDALNFNRHTLNEESYRAAAPAGVIIYQSILAENDNKEGAEKAVHLGADILETDHPGLIRSYLERKGLAKPSPQLHDSPQHIFLEDQEL